MTWTDPRTWVAGEPLLAAQLNEQVRDNLKTLGDPWTEYTTLWEGGATDPVLGNGTLRSVYLQAGRMVIFRICLTMGSSTTYGSGLWSLTLPVPLSDEYPRQGFSGIARDESALNDYPVAGICNGGDTVMPLKAYPIDAGGMTNITPTAPITWTTGDSFVIDGTYEVA